MKHETASPRPVDRDFRIGHDAFSGKKPAALTGR